MALKLKGVDYDTGLIRFAPRPVPEWFDKMVPGGRFPVLQIDGKPLSNAKDIFLVGLN